MKFLISLIIIENDRPVSDKGRKNMVATRRTDKKFRVEVSLSVVVEFRNRLGQ